MEEQQSTVADAYIQECRKQLTAKFDKIDHCLRQLNDEQIWWRPHEHVNSIGNIVLHLCGNLRQWIMHGIGGAEDDRDRPAEFADHGPIERDELLRQLRTAVSEASQTLASTTEQELLRVRRIQGFDVSGLSAIFDSVSHLAGHTQEIIYITRTQLGHAYQFHWQPGSAEEGT